MKYSKSGISMIFVMVFIFLISLFGVMVINYQSYINSSINFFQKEIIHKNNFTFKSLLEKDIAQEKTKSGVYRDILKCPTEIRYLSGSDLIYQTNQIDFIIDNDNNYYCSWSLNSLNVQLYYDTTFSSFSWWKYNENDFSFNNNLWTLSASYGIEILNNTEIYDYASYKTYIYGYLKSEFDVMFFNNNIYNDYINNNIYNQSNYRNIISNTFSGLVYLDIDRDINLKILQIDKNIFDSTKKIIINDIIFSWSLLAGSWYINIAHSHLETNTGSITTHFLDFKNNYYIFLWSSKDLFTWFRLWVYDRVKNSHSFLWSIYESEKEILIQNIQHIGNLDYIYDYDFINY